MLKNYIYIYMDIYILKDYIKNLCKETTKDLYY